MVSHSESDAVELDRQPLEGSEREPSSHVRQVPVFRPSSKIGVALLVFGLAYGADQLSKFWVQKTMTLGESITLIEGFFRWRYILNPGAAFSMGENHTWIFTLIMLVAALICAVSLVRARARSWVIALSLLLGGILGNLTDRLFREPSFGMGHVVDFISVGNFAIFNIADSCICVSMAIIVYLVFRGINLDGTIAESEESQKVKK